MTRTSKTRLVLESLDRRDMMTVYLAGGLLQITGDGSNDLVTVSYNAGTSSGIQDDTVTVTRDYGSYGDPSENLFTSIYPEQRTYPAFRQVTPGSTSWIPNVILINCDLKDGLNTFTNSTWIASSVTGGKDKDVMNGGSGPDTFRGNGGNDLLYGNDGPDRLYGESGFDYMDGNSGRDWLYGGPDPDTLKGGPGVDGLYGGGGVDILDGYGGSDRFLLPANDTDIVRGYNGVEDVKVFFDGTDETVDYDDDTSYAGKLWAESDIEDVDRALAAMHEKTGNAHFLTRYGLAMHIAIGSGAMPFVDDTMTIRRVGGKVSGKDLDGWNDNAGTITLTSNAFSYKSNTYQTTIHEMGHNWDDYGFDHGFLALSGWTDSNPHSSNYTKISKYGENWWRWTSAQFVSTYADDHPAEDFAESFAAYFLDAAGLTHSGGGWTGASAASAKMQWMGALVSLYTIPID